DLAERRCDLGLVVDLDRPRYRDAELAGERNGAGLAHGDIERRLTPHCEGGMRLELVTTAPHRLDRAVVRRYDDSWARLLDDDERSVDVPRGVRREVRDGLTSRAEPRLQARCPPRFRIAGDGPHGETPTRERAHARQCLTVLSVKEEDVDGGATHSVPT